MSQAEPRRSPRESSFSFGRSLTFRLIAAIVLIIFVCVLGDYRRKGNAMLQAERYAVGLVDRLEGGGTIPLNLDPAGWELGDDDVFHLEWLSREDARCLRERAPRMLVAWSPPMPLVFAANGHAAVLMDNGRLRVVWLTLAEFSRATEAQSAVLRSCAATEAPKKPTGP